MKKNSLIILRLDSQNYLQIIASNNKIKTKIITITNGVNLTSKNARAHA